MTYEKKVARCAAQSPLARSLHPTMYENNPTFLPLPGGHSLAFMPYPSSFTKTDVDKRQALYRDLAEIIWSPGRYGLV